ncbi:MAG TPA: CPBP family intramembrane metalloprotease [Anaerolineales bacterium]|nr:CPBP family intramembrane metalloprotease [Anaerolineales bacterium]
MKQRLGLILLATIITTTFVIQILKLSNKSIAEEGHILFLLMITLLGILTLVAPLILLWLEADKLDRFRIDKYSLFTLGVCYLINLNYNRQNYVIFIIIGFSLIYLVKIYHKKKGGIISSDLLWSAKAFALASAFILAIVVFQISIGSIVQIPLLTGNVFVIMLRQVFTELSFVPVEELFYRGFLWGYLISIGWEERTVIWVQGGVFWITHVERLTTPISFFIFIPILTLILSKLRQRSNQVFPSIIAHVIINAAGALLNLATI